MLLDEGHVERIASFARIELGIRVSDHRLKSAYKDLQVRCDANNTGNLGTYLDAAIGAKSGHEREFLISRLLVNTTEFFREPYHFHILGSILLSDQQVGHFSKSDTYKIWSAGCSSGQEPYSIAMCALNALGEVAVDCVKVVGTDAANDCIRKARIAQYSEAEVSMIGARTLSKYFFRSGPKSDLFEVDASVRRIVSFELQNLLDLMKTRKQVADFHTILCRNTLMYFVPSVRRQVVEYFAQCLRPGGFLFVGHSEDVESALFERIGKSVYQLKLT